jgi:hypothetical protein
MPALSAKEVSSPNDLKGRQRPLPGKYHVAINHWDETCSKKNELVVGFVVLDGTTPGMVGREIQTSMLFEYDGKDLTDRIVRLALCCGLLQPGQECDEDLTHKANGKQLVIEVVEREYEDKKTGEKKKVVDLGNFGYATWAVDDQLVVDVQKNQNALRNRGNANTTNTNGNGATKPASGSSGWDDV